MHNPSDYLKYYQIFGATTTWKHCCQHNMAKSFSFNELSYVYVYVVSVSLYALCIQIPVEEEEVGKSPGTQLSQAVVTGSCEPSDLGVEN